MASVTLGIMTFGGTWGPQKTSWVFARQTLPSRRLALHPTPRPASCDSLSAGPFMHRLNRVPWQLYLGKARKRGMNEVPTSEGKTELQGKRPPLA